MKRIVAILVLLLATGAIGYTPPADKLPPIVGPPTVDARTTVVVVGGTTPAEEPGGCATQSVGQNNTTADDDDYVDATNWRGQSFTLASGGDIYSIKFKSGSDSWSLVATCYLDDDIGDPTVESIDSCTLSLSGGATVGECVFSSTHTLSAQKYYVMCARSSGDGYLLYADENPYAGGGLLWTTSGHTGWAESSTEDYWFQVMMCD